MMSPTCSICGDPIDIESTGGVRLSNTVAPRRYRGAAGMIAALGDTFATVVRTAQGIPEETYWFHPGCWERFRDLLKTGTPKP